MTINIGQLTQNLNPLTLKIASHPLYNNITSITDIRVFMEQHVFAVWDFMCLLKELYCRLVSTTAPWFPPKDAFSANLISRILVEEEGDITEDGIHYASHYDMYVTAMEKIGASTFAIKKLLMLLMNGSNLVEAINSVQIRPATKNFVLNTFSFFKLETHELAAAFVYGRENITAVMFRPLLKKLLFELNTEKDNQFSTLIYYFKRHIELDDNSHFPKAVKMLSHLIGDDEKKLQQAEAAATKALLARIDFLNSIHQLVSHETVAA